MKSRSGIWGAWLFSATLFATFATVHAAENILVMAWDADRDYVRCDSRDFVAALGAVRGKLVESGFRVYDETNVTMDGFDQGRCRRPKSELIDIAQSINANISVAVLVRLQRRVEQLEYTTKITARIEGQMQYVDDGELLHSFRGPQPRKWNVATACRTDCIVDSVYEKAAQVLGKELGFELAETLSAPNERIRKYTLEFKNFSDDDLNVIEEFLRMSSCYSEHYLIEQEHTYAIYAYHSCTTDLRKKLHWMLGKIQERSDPRWGFSIHRKRMEFTVEKEPPRNARSTGDELGD